MSEFETLTFEDFAEAVKEILEEVTYGKASVSLYEVLKNNGRYMKAVTILESDKTNVSPTIYLKDFYEEYLRKGFTESVNSIIEVYERNKVKGYTDFNFLYSYEKVRQRLMPRLINYNKNMELLKNVPHIRYLDLAVAFHYLILKEDGYASIMITDTLNEKWLHTPEKLYKDAMFNLEKNIYLNPMIDEIKTLTGFMEILEDDNSRIKDLHILSNYAKFYGAASLLSKQVLKSYAEKMKCGRIVILPSSVHEVLLLPIRFESDYKELKEMVEIINGSGAVRDEEFLSDNIYVYNKESERISMA